MCGFSRSISSSAHRMRRVLSMAIGVQCGGLRERRRRDDPSWYRPRRDGAKPRSGDAVSRAGRRLRIRCRVGSCRIVRSHREAPPMRPISPCLLAVLLTFAGLAHAAAPAKSVKSAAAKPAAVAAAKPQGLPAPVLAAGHAVDPARLEAHVRTL